MIGVIFFCASLVGLGAFAFEVGRDKPIAGIAVGLLGLGCTFLVPFALYIIPFLTVIGVQKLRTRRMIMLAEGGLDDEEKILDVFD